MAKSKMLEINGTVYDVEYYRSRPGHPCLRAEVFATAYVKDADTGEFLLPGDTKYTHDFVGMFIRNTVAVNHDGTANKAFRKVRRCWPPAGAGSFHGKDERGCTADIGKVDTDREAIIMLVWAAQTRALAGMTV